MKRYGLMLLATATLAACGEDDGVMPTVAQTFEVTVENVSTVYDFPQSGHFDTPAGEAAPGPLFPGGV